MTGMILNTEFAFDQVGNSPAGPQRRCVAERFRASFQQLAEALQIRFAQLRLAAHASGLPQRFLAALVVLPPPPAPRLAADFQPNRDFGLVEISLLQQSNGFHPALLQRIKITCHSSRIPHTESNSFSRQKCRYIMRSSIRRFRRSRNGAICTSSNLPKTSGDTWKDSRSRLVQTQFAIAPGSSAGVTRRSP